MYKILIVDDEDIARIGIQTLLKWEDYGFQISYKATNGLEALKIVSSEKPDLVISDVVMPVMDGIEMVRKLKAENYEGEIIIISNYNNFEAVKQLIRLGIEDYLLKVSYSTADFIKILNNVKGKLDLKYHLNPKELEVEKRNSRTLYFDRSLAANEPITLSSIFYAKLLNHNKEHMQTSKNKMQIVIEENFKNQKYEAFFISDHEMLVILELDSTHPISVHTEMRIHKMLELYTMEPSIILSVEKIRDIQSLHSNVSECRKATENIFYGTVCGNIKNYQNTQISEYIYAVQNATHFIRLLDNEGIDQIELELQKMLEDFKKNRVFPSQLLDFVETTMVVIKAQVNKIYEIEVNDILLIDIKSCLSFEELQGICQQLFEDIKNGILAETSRKIKVNGTSDDEIIDKVVTYINQNIHKKITLSDIAKEVSMHPNYFSAYFNKRMPCSIPKFINNLKLHYAKELLETKNMRVKDIAEEIGISEVSYFCKLYKERYGCPPSETESVQKDNIKF